MTSAQALELLTPKSFIAWLTSLGEAFVGQEHSSCQCPIAAFFSAKGIKVRIGNLFDLSSFTVLGEERAELPEFWQSIACAIDEGEASRISTSVDENNCAVYRPWAPDIIRVMHSDFEEVNDCIT